jgi:hypothetical protein
VPPRRPGYGPDPSGPPPPGYGAGPAGPPPSGRPRPRPEAGRRWPPVVVPRCRPRPPRHLVRRHLVRRADHRGGVRRTTRHRGASSWFPGAVSRAIRRPTVSRRCRHRTHRRAVYRTRRRGIRAATRPARVALTRVTGLPVPWIRAPTRPARVAPPGGSRRRRHLRPVGHGRTCHRHRLPATDRLPLRRGRRSARRDPATRPSPIPPYLRPTPTGADTTSLASNRRPARYPTRLPVASGAAPRWLLRPPPAGTGRRLPSHRRPDSGPERARSGRSVGRPARGAGTPGTWEPDSKRDALGSPGVQRTPPARRDNGRRAASRPPADWSPTRTRRTVGVPLPTTPTAGGPGRKRRAGVARHPSHRPVAGLRFRSRRAGGYRRDTGRLA